MLGDFAEPDGAGGWHSAGLPPISNMREAAAFRMAVVGDHIREAGAACRIQVGAGYSLAVVGAHKPQAVAVAAAVR